MAQALGFVLGTVALGLGFDLAGGWEAASSSEWARSALRRKSRHIPMPTACHLWLALLACRARHPPQPGRGVHSAGRRAVQRARAPPRPGRRPAAAGLGAGARLGGAGRGRRGHRQHLLGHDPHVGRGRLALGHLHRLAGRGCGRRGGSRRAGGAQVRKKACRLRCQRGSSLFWEGGQVVCTALPHPPQAPRTEAACPRRLRCAAGRASRAWSRPSPQCSCQARRRARASRPLAAQTWRWRRAAPGQRASRPAAPRRSGLVDRSVLFCLSKVSAFQPSLTILFCS